jgi:phytanoyl-CoA hydroxylase
MKTPGSAMERVMAGGEPMWVDTDAADERIAAIRRMQGRADLADRLAEFRERGYAIFRQAVAPELIDRYVAEFDRAVASDRTLLTSRGLEIAPAMERDLHEPIVKTLDTLVKLPSALPLAFADPLVDFLEEIFEDKPLAFQSLHFEVGSTQAVHQDTAYVVLNQPRKLAAAWIALEDIRPGTGALVYYPGSHRFGEFLYPEERKHWEPAKDGDAIHQHHLGWLHEIARVRGVEQESFLPKKGDVLIWHADLAHGGGEITEAGSTRRSLVVHYGPMSSDPVYFGSVKPERRVKKRVPGGYVSSMYYTIGAPQPAAA